MYNVLFIGLFGALGAMSRYGANRLCFAVFGDRFAVGTLIVNVIGCFLLGLLVPLGHRLGSDWERVLARRLFPDRVELPPGWGKVYRREWITASIGANTLHRARFSF